MEVKNYTIPVENGMIVKHGSKLRFTVKSGNTILEDSLTDAESIGGAITLAGYIYNRASISGGISWWNPSTGQTITRPKITIRANPDDIVTEEHANSD